MYDSFTKDDIKSGWFLYVLTLFDRIALNQTWFSLLILYLFNSKAHYFIKSHTYIYTDVYSNYAECFGYFIHTLHDRHSCRFYC